MGRRYYEIRFILLLLLTTIWFFDANAKVSIKNSAIITHYHHQGHSYGELESAHLPIVSFGMIKGKNMSSHPVTLDNKCLYHFKYIDRQKKRNFTARNINLLPGVRKDIHFLSIYLI